MGQKEKLIQETAALIKGNIFAIIRNGVEISFRLYWEVDKSPTVDIQTVKFVKKPSLLETLLLDLVPPATLEDLNWHPTLSKSKPFLDWDRRIKKVCAQADVLEATTKICFDPDILDPAERIAAKSR